MPLDPNMKMLLDQMASIGAPPLHTMSVADARSGMDAMVMMMGAGEQVASVEDRVIDAGGQQLPIRIYRPEAVGDGSAPTLVFYHGGGFVIGGLTSHDRDCRALAKRGGCQVIAIDYRLAPEHPFPAAVEDAVAARCRCASTGRQALATDRRRRSSSTTAVGSSSAASRRTTVTAGRSPTAVAAR